MNIKNLKELEAVSVLRDRDDITFKVNCVQGGSIDLQYYVVDTDQSAFLALKGGDSDNDIIFRKLDLDKRDFCARAYGYTSTIGERWPSAKHNDLEALTRVVRALYKVLENKESEDEEETDRFYLIDFD